MSLSIQTTVFAITIFGIFYFFLKEKKKYKNSGCNIPRYKHDYPLFGSLIIPIYPKHYIKAIEVMKGTMTFYTTLFSTPTIISGDKDVAEHVFKECPKSLDSIAMKNLVLFSGKFDLLYLQHGIDQPWKRTRRLLEPAFKISSIKILIPIFNKHSTNLVNKLKGKCEKNGVYSFDFCKIIYDITFSIIADAGFGLENVKIDKFRKAIDTIMTGLFNPLMAFPGGWKLLKYKFRKEMELIDNIIYEIIDKRTEEKLLCNDNQGDDILDFLMKPDFEGNYLSRVELRDNLFLLFVAGHETTATILSWLFYHICNDEEIYNKLTKEIDEVVGYEDINENHIRKLVYLQNCIYETLRLSPPTPGITRHIDKTFEINGLIFPKGFDISCSPHMIHNNPLYWSEPENFKPDRFSEENSNSIIHGTFIPFSSGPRICIGKNFFYYSAKIVSASLLRNFTFEALKDSVGHGKYLDSPVYKPEKVCVRVSVRK